MYCSLSLSLSHLPFLHKVDIMPQNSPKFGEMFHSQGGFSSSFILPAVLKLPQFVGEVWRDHREADTIGSIVDPRQTKLGSRRLILAAFRTFTYMNLLNDHWLYYINTARYTTSMYRYHAYHLQKISFWLGIVDSDHKTSKNLNAPGSPCTCMAKVSTTCSQICNM